MEKEIGLAVDSLKKDEGFRSYLYDDSTGKRIIQLRNGGYPTIGYGFNLGRSALPEHIAARLLTDRVLDDHGFLVKYEPGYVRLNVVRRAVLLNMAYNLGINGLLGFSKMWAALDKGDYEQAAKEILESKAGRELKDRYGALATLMRTGQLHEKTRELPAKQRA